MISDMLEHARAQASHSARTAGIGVFAGLALIVGLAFWTGAAWYLLTAITTKANACLIIGAVYTGAGLIGFAIASMRGKKHIEPPQPVKQPEANMESLVSAFITGMNAGARRRP